MCGLFTDMVEPSFLEEVINYWTKQIASKNAATDCDKFSLAES